MTSVALLVHLVTTAVLGIIALVSTVLVIYRILSYERARLNDAETHAFRLLDEMLRSLFPRNLGRRLSELYKAEIQDSAKNKLANNKEEKPPAQPAPQIQPIPPVAEPDYENVHIGN